MAIRPDVPPLGYFVHSILSCSIDKMHLRRAVSSGQHRSLVYDDTTAGLPPGVPVISG